ncbi:unnamed protein product [Linum tenue]|uniref:Uncharacterized protein n=1 Tax=Linum tenue TaxID=586396 RepID=A0AAV0JIL3_9ROSI|nr:unnamed protein product [Linum tenue]
MQARSSPPYVQTRTTSGTSRLEKTDSLSRRTCLARSGELTTM